MPKGYDSIFSIVGDNGEANHRFENKAQISDLVLFQQAKSVGLK